MSKILTKRAPYFLRKILNKIGVNNASIPPVGKVDLGDLDRTSPFSITYGYQRGGPVDRIYIESFLQKNASKIKGKVLEIGDNKYTKKYGGNHVTTSEILHVDSSNKSATYIGNLSDAPHLPADTFDCIILTQTLHLIYDYKSAIATCYRILKPGGTLLLTVPGISHIGPDEWSWLWSFTGESIKRILSEVYTEENITIVTYGNVLAATAFLYGLGRSDINPEKLNEHDHHYQLIIAASAEK